MEHIKVEKSAKSGTKNGKPSEKKGRIVPRLTDVSTIEIKPIEWLWYNKFHYGGLSILTGLPKQGKSMLTAYMSAVISRGWKWCDDAPCERGSILLFSGEDSPEEYARRLKGNEADLTKIRILDGATLFPEDSSEGLEIGITLARLDVLEAAIDQTEKETGLPVRMVVIDPISNFWGDVKENSNADVRRVLHPLQQFFNKQRIAAVLIQHLRKASEGEAQLRIMGSTAIAGVARNLWGVYIDPHDPALKQSEKKRYLVPFPSNVCIDPTAVSFLIVPPDGRIDVVDCDIEKTGNDFEAAWQHAKAKGRPPEKKNECLDWLFPYVGGQMRSEKEIMSAAEEQGFSAGTIKRAKKELGVKSKRIDGQWFWFLPQDDDQSQEAQND